MRNRPLAHPPPPRGEGAFSPFPPREGGRGVGFLAWVFALLLGIPSLTHALALSPGTVVASGLSDENLLGRTESAFARGIEHRGDADLARDWFRAAAAGYDELWRRGHHTPALALNRG